MGEDGPNVIYRTRIRVRTAILVATFLVLLAVYGYTSERYPPEEKAGRPVSTVQEQVKSTRTPSSTSSTRSMSSTTESSSASESEDTTTDEESSTDTTDTSDETLTSTARRPKLTTTSVPGIPVPIPRITTEDGDETTTADESSAP